MKSASFNLKLRNNKFSLEDKKTSSINFKAIIILVTSFIVMIAAAYVVYLLQDDFSKFNFNRLNNKFGFLFFTLAASLFVFGVLTFIYHGYLYFKYKAIASVSNEELPTITVIVPAYNEEKQVWATLKSLAKSDYPKEKLQLLSIDDGSKDDTWY